MPEQPIEPASHYYMSQRLRLHHVDWGNAGASPLILLHGGRDHCRAWDWVAADLRRDYHVIAPDLRGHGDSEWSSDGGYSPTAHLYDLAQLIHQQRLAPVTIVAHSFGGAIALRYAGVYPEAVARLVVIEGLAPARETIAAEARLDGWIAAQRALSARHPRRYRSIEEAAARMRAENARLTPEQARHLTILGMNRNEDGSYSWKFDNYSRTTFPADLTRDETHRLWARIACPTLLVHGCESWASDPAADGRIAHFRDARVASFEGAGHWVHHDRLDAFVAAVRAFLAG